MISLAEFQENVRKCWRFILDITWDQNRRHPELPRSTCMKERSFLHSLLGGNEISFFEKACRLADQVQTREEMEVLLPELVGWMTENKFPVTPDNPSFAEGRTFRYDVLKESNWCYIHIRNAKMPQSFLKDPHYVADNLRFIMDLAEKEHQCDTIYTASWLNDYPPFLRFFPEEWQKNLTDTGEFGATGGWQGQFINGRGLLNEAHAAKFLENGVLPCARRESHCSFEALRQHLNKLGL